MKRLTALLLFLAPAVPWLQMRIESALGEFRPQEEALYLWSGKHIKAAVPGFEGIAADVYWLRTVQYFGGQLVFSRDRNFALLYPLVDIATTLDPRLEVAYRYGAVFLSEPAPVGAGRPREGIAILERGVAAVPGNWRLRQDLGFFTYLFLHDVKRAAGILEEAADVPGAPFWLRTLAADLLLKGGERQTARAMWTQMYEQAEEALVKENARLRLLQLDALDRADTLTALVAELERRTGRRPASLAELAASGLARGPLVDPAGVPFDYDPATGKVGLSRRSSLWRTD